MCGLAAGLVSDNNLTSKPSITDNTYLYLQSEVEPKIVIAKSKKYNLNFYREG